MPQFSLSCSSVDCHSSATSNATTPAAPPREFTTQEWIDVIISAVDYNPDGYCNKDGEVSEETKLFFLRRLLPFVEKRLNMIELAPKGTGKSYVFEKISKRGWLISGGTVSRASLIYDNAKKVGGLLTRFDYVGFDEVQSITFEQPGQILAALLDKNPSQ